MELIFTLAPFLALLAPVINIALLIWWRGLWRWLALMPWLVVFGIAVWIYSELERHNLLSVEVLIYGTLWFFVLLGLLIVNRVTVWLGRRADLM